MAEIDVAVFTFDPERRCVWSIAPAKICWPTDGQVARPARERSRPGRLSRADEDAPLTLSFPAAPAAGACAGAHFRERGLPHELLVLTDLSRTLREEERNAWQRLVRVLGHEMNNSLAPIKSIAGSLETLIRRDPPPPDWRDDARSGLNVIATRAESLSRFMQAYARLARLPPPQKEEIDLGELVRRVAESGNAAGGAGCARPGDYDSLRMRRRSSNCSSTFCTTRSEASLETDGGVAVGWREAGECVEVFVQRRRTGHHESDKFVRSVFHDQAGRLGNWPGAQPADCGSARRIADAGESPRTFRLRSAVAFASIRRRPCQARQE